VFSKLQDSGSGTRDGKPRYGGNLKDCWKMLGTGHGDRFSNSNSLAEMEYGVRIPEAENSLICLFLVGWSVVKRSIGRFVPGGRVFLGGSVDP
jgi:hypothetical protein